VPGPFDDQPTRLGNVDARLLDDGVIDDALATMPGDRFLGAVTEPQSMLGMHDELDEATRLSPALDTGTVRQPPPPAPRQPPPPRSGQPRQAPALDERTRAVDIRNDPSMSDVDWDID
jgi:hypothetical protein